MACDAIKKTYGESGIRHVSRSIQYGPARTKVAASLPAKKNGIRVPTVSLLFVSWLSVAFVPRASGDPFYMGADISLQTFMEQQNVQFFDDGVARPLHALLYDRGANLFRLRIFVNPETTYTTTNFGAIQTQAYDIALAQQIKAYAPNAKILLDFMYSDTWAHPGQQVKPAAWVSQDFATLQSTVRTYTQNTLQAFKDAGVMPEMVQLGNEISTGMIFGTTADPAGGRLVFNGSTATQQASWQNLGLLLNSAIQGVRAVQDPLKPIEIGIHVNNGAQIGLPQFFYGNLTNPAWGNVSDFDMVGVSFYPAASAVLNNLGNNLNAIADTYPGKKIMVLETHSPWEDSDTGLDPPWPKTPEGQKQFLIDLQNVMLNLHNNAGAGIVWWYPEAVLLPGFGIYNGGETALFDGSHNALPALDTFAITLVPGDVDGDGDVDLDDFDSIRLHFNAELAGRPAGDLNRDGIVDFADFGLWKDRFLNLSGGSSSLGSTSAPESASAALIAMQLLLSWGAFRLRGNIT
jgi:arabinogalactan endo-1,4-beta-galactosidase